jgi:hypothetical protein
MWRCPTYRVIEAQQDGNAGFISGQSLIEEVVPQ